MRFFARIAVFLLQLPVAAAFIAPAATDCQCFASRRYMSRKSCNSVESLMLTLSRLYNAKAATDDEATGEEQCTKITFESPKFQVYIEDTDGEIYIFNVRL